MVRSEKKLVQHLKRRQETELRQIAKARALVLPDNKPQERTLTIAPFLARYGQIGKEAGAASEPPTGTRAGPDCQGPSTGPAGQQAARTHPHHCAVPGTIWSDRKRSWCSI